MPAGVTPRIDCQIRPRVCKNVRSARSIRGGLEPGCSAIRRNTRPATSVTGRGDHSMQVIGIMGNEQQLPRLHTRIDGRVCLLTACRQTLLDWPLGADPSRTYRCPGTRVSNMSSRVTACLLLHLITVLSFAGGYIQSIANPIECSPAD